MSTLTLLKRKAVEPASSPGASNPEKPPPVPLEAENFWLVWLVGSKAPSYRHPTLESAAKERNRLKAVRPQGHYFIFEPRCTRISQALC